MRLAIWANIAHQGRMRITGISVVLASALFAACSTTSERPAQPMRPASSAELSFGYQEAIDLGSRYVADYGYANTKLHGAEQLYPNIWRVRFGLAPEGSNGILELYFDGANRTLVKAEELQGIGGTLVPDKLVPPPPPRRDPD